MLNNGRDQTKQWKALVYPILQAHHTTTNPVDKQKVSMAHKKF